MLTTLERFHRNYLVDEDGCWLWSLKPDQFGYGFFKVGGRAGRKVRVHRWSYEHFIGPIPEGMQVDHTCHNSSGCPGGVTCKHRRCCNPAHLLAVSNLQNQHNSPNTLASIHSAKTHCVQGHPLSGANMRVDKRGQRVCRACVRQAQTRLREKRKSTH